jgi:hypothetical protein
MHCHKSVAVELSTMNGANLMAKPSTDTKSVSNDDVETVQNALASAGIPSSAIDPFDPSKIDLSQLDFDQLVGMLDADALVHIGDLDDTTQVDKDMLIGVPFVITEWLNRPSQGMGEYVVVRATTREGKVVFADGSTGIKEQLIAFAERQEGKPILCPKGLRVSTYMFTNDDTGEIAPAKTFYLDTSR